MNSNSTCIKKIMLVDELKHPGYSWPRTLLSYPMEFKATKIDLDSFQLKDDNQLNLPFQISDIRKYDKGYSANISFIADLPYGTESVFYLNQVVLTEKQGKIWSNYNDVEKDTICISNHELYLKINKTVSKSDIGKYYIFQIGSAKEKLNGIAYLETDKAIETYSVEVAETGCVFTQCNIKVLFVGGGCYKISLRITEAIEFVEMQENIENFEQDDETKLLIEWNDFNPERRYAGFRDYEKIDEYNENGIMPFKLLPYSNWVSWWEVKAAAFIDNKQGKSVGVFIRNAEKWDDGQYAIWGSSDSQALRFRYEYEKDFEGKLLWEYPMVNGYRGTAIALYDCNKDNECNQKSYIEYLWFWHEYISLNKVKDWVLRWEEDQSAFPRFFPEESLPEAGVEVWHYGMRKEPFLPEFVEEIMYKLSQNMNKLYILGPVAAREFFSWVYVFDMAAPKMSLEQFNNLKACCAFMAYAHMDENFMPIEKMLSGHPNFLADVRAVPALMASLFPAHPHSNKWVQQFEKAMALNLKYHIRPEVKSWNSEGGRWTENLGCYNFAALTPMMRTAVLVYKAFGDNVLMYPNVKKWTQYMLNALTAPINGKRAFPPQGAHSGHYLDPMIPTSDVHLLADRLFRYSPLQAEYLLNICEADAPAFEEKVPGSDIYKYLYDGSLKHNKGTRPYLKSSKFTGYGYVLRSSFGDENEMSVHLQQIDEGPNYRWGRAGQGGCGVIHYTAAGKRYSYNRPEDVGDANMGDVQACCNFGVLIGHEYKSVGRSDLTEPMYDFGFAQFSQVNAGEYSQPFYKSRSVLISGNDYIVIFDQVGDMRVCGRFAWFVKNTEELPQIVQLKPGVAGQLVEAGVPIEEYGNHVTTKNQSKGVIYNGSGDFLTLVSHRLLNSEFNIYVCKTDYGAEVRFPGRLDRVFRDSSLIRHRDAKCSFIGYAGIVKLYGDSKAEAALFKGIEIGALGVEVSIQSHTGEVPQVGISFAIDRGQLLGNAACSKTANIKVKLPNKYQSKKYKLFIDSILHEFSFIDDNMFVFELPAGTHTWQWTDSLPMPQQTVVLNTVVEAGSVKIIWKESKGAEEYEIDISRDGGKSWRTVLKQVKETSCVLSGFENPTKLHVRIRGINEHYQGEWSPDYPVYITDKVPEAVEGLKVWKCEKNDLRLLWGWQLGVESYRLYKREKETDDYTLIYEGSECEYIDEDIEFNKIYEYTVSAVNGNGEGKKSLPRDNALDGLAYWDTQPESGFRRYTKCYEFGYNGFDHWSNFKNNELKY